MNFNKKLQYNLRIKLITFLSKIGIYKKLPIFYIGGSEALPPPLSNEEENYLLAKLEESDLGVKTILIERNLRLVVYIARKFENTGVGVEDLVSIGTIGLIKAINTFNPSRNIKLATYASRCIENEILMYLRRSNRIKTEISIDEPLNIDWDGNELLLSDILGTENDIVYRNIEDEVDKELLDSAMDKLSNREKKIMELRFGLANGEEKTQKEVADMLGISQSYISRLEKRIINRLKKEITRMI
ncbi:MAG TPA: RNA polymerase sporulation sigma factor SigE [Clostridiaceae bacterium]|nr:RNA polymerase sporulation sigma factor SigE [Clostridiaceae bacterium]